jgi:predicted ATPase
MIDLCRVKGFKCFLEQDLELSNLTLFTGLNNSGKSSAVQAIRMALSERAQVGPYIDGLGGFLELASDFSEKDAPINISLLTNNDEVGSLKLTSDGFVFAKGEGLPLVQFISADRYGPRVALPLMRDDESFLNVGVRGEFSAHFGDLMEGVIVSEMMRHPDCASNILKHQLVWWMSEISPGVKLDFNVMRKYDSSHIEVNGLRPTNSGFGISYVLPVLLALLCMSARMEDDSEPKLKAWFEHLKLWSSMLLIENPEAHLHPRGQTLIGRLAALASVSGGQIIMETHSDHIIDGVRLAVKRESQIPAEAVKIKYFTKKPEESSLVEDISVMKNGRLDHWPVGFFDQGSLNLRLLASKV